MYPLLWLPAFNPPTKNHAVMHSSDDQLPFFREFVLWDLEIQRRRPPPHSPRDVVMRAVAGAEPATIVSGLAYRYTPEMCADACV